MSVCVSDVESVLTSVHSAAMFTTLIPMICACVGPVAIADLHVRSSLLTAVYLVCLSVSLSVCQCSCRRDMLSSQTRHVPNVQSVSKKLDTVKTMGTRGKINTI